jgi:hypothetical protein
MGRNSRDLEAIFSDQDHTQILLKYIEKTRGFTDLGDVSLMRNSP